MKRTSIGGVFLLACLLYVPSGAWADTPQVKAVCPATANRGAAVSATVIFTNDQFSTIQITKYGLAQHFGGLSLSGPKTTAFGSPVNIAAATASLTDFCPPSGCFQNVITPATASTTINFTMPTAVTSKQLVSAGFIFLGTKGGNPLRKPLATAGCVIEVN